MRSVRVLDVVSVAHGGVQRWSELHELRLSLRIGGNILALKLTSPHTRSLECTVSTRRICISLSPYPKRGTKGLIDGESVKLQTHEGATIAERKIVRTDGGKVVRRMIWDDLELLYFLGYAIWNYAMTPFLFLWPGFECREGNEWRERDGSLRRTLDVTFPAAFPTHCRRQTFYFDAQGLLRRLDYTAEVFGSYARGAHYCEDYREFDGLLFPTHRVVFPRLGSGHPLKLVKVMEGWLDRVTAR
jgi:hypothetical protein